jgi:NAD(P)H-flavin reductase/hemoglobin-like flavoprotein
VTVPAGQDEPEGNPALLPFSLLEPVADAAMTYFYGQLFAMDQEIAAMFPAALDGQRRRFFYALHRIAAGQDNPAGLVPYLERLGREHRKDGIRDKHFAVFRRALLATMRQFGGSAWTDKAEAAWVAAYDHAARVMLRAASSEPGPAWWICTVVRTEPRTPGIAVLTLEPDQPLRFLPGQHVSVQTLHWPRLWRTYSIANAPRQDGKITLHVRAAEGGMVSHALVHHVRAGDPLVLGAPEGPMIADTSSRRDVLCLAGGTGLAPIKAIVEAIIATPFHGTGRRREIALYVGARCHRDLYDLAMLRDMELAYPWLQVLPAVSAEPASAGVVRDVLPGTIPQLAAKASWPGRDIYISGPDEMIRKTVRVLKDLGAPDERIHFDLPAENAPLASA